MTTNKLNRRDFITRSSLLAGGVAAAPSLGMKGNIFKEGKK